MSASNSVQPIPSTAYSLPAGAGKRMAWFDAAITLKASNSAIGVVEFFMSPGNEPPLHVHTNEDEWFYVLDGEMKFHVGGDIHPGKVGAFVFFPRGIPHTFAIESQTARFLLINTPGGFERMFELAPATPEDAIRALNTYGIEAVGPHPRYALAA